MNEKVQIKSKNPKIWKKSKKVQKIPENKDFFLFSDLNLRTPNRRVVNPSGYKTNVVDKL